MRRLVPPIVIGLLCLLLAPSLARAGDPPFYVADIDCHCVADAASSGASLALPFNCTISPSGGAGGTDPSEDVRVDVIIRNVLYAPIAGATVVVTPVPFGGVVMRWDDGSSPAGDTDERNETGITAADGSVEFLFDEGVVAIPSGLGGLPNLDFQLTAQGPGPGGPVVLPPCPVDLTVHGYDQDADGDVDLRDFGTFATRFRTGDLRADFTHTTGVGLADFGLFAANYGADLDNQ